MMIIILCAAPIVDNVSPEPEASPNLTTLDQDADRQASNIEADQSSEI